jgi:3-hydroxybutyryl-CoA dehydrogenase
MEMDKIRNIVVIGTGVMGPDIALGFSLAGYPVRGIDIEGKFLDQASRKIEANCQQMTEWGLISEEEAQAAQKRISLSLDFGATVKDAHYITEAIPEVFDLKRKVLKECSKICPPETVIASNTSTMDITSLGFDMVNPQRLIGTHWFIPAHLTPPVEVVRGEKTSEATHQLVFDLLRRVGKLPVACRNHPGFIHNYIQMAMTNAALALVDQGIATPEDVDTVIENGFALRLPTTGPFKFMDLAGLDTIFNALKYLYEKTGQPIYKPARILKEKVQKSEFGLKTGKGFYSYSPKEAERARTRTNQTIAILKKALQKEKF